MRKINTLIELKEERKQLLQKQSELELAIKMDIQEIKEKLSPAHILANIGGNLTMNKSDGLYGYAMSALAHLVIDKIVLRKSGFLPRFLTSYFVKNLAVNMISKNKETIFNWISSLLHKSSKFPEKSYANAGYENT